ncbi:5-methyltetrahydropteroyltriglutamate--homocysteine methyltransferase [Philodulcilactobacillus myokoensis]|uniref:5-methyltetrahydropteroyltriglutamate--homocysteine methyltransferase n=1 Tax=Philodulcilactobacillus myokoensis TaxID=2929573 RepID=A0A9W6B226_9LACO|nr:5-methyltetrahydropteroyltriglutamate--homocysteine S-methyltransferase [Philodulcilactobacillus myokoensis]GLB47442.1 5-methyltetrahydropteroyltriglutamate--homocysteine methyltransferase [Philodulcilactobacillus myokoensis]
MSTTIIGFPRIGHHRELKFATEHYWKHEIDQKALLKVGRQLRKTHWLAQKKAGIDLIPVGDFSFYDNLLDVANVLNIVPSRYKQLKLSKLDEYFAQAQGYQSNQGNVRALPLKKWFNTNYHYIVPEFSDETNIKLVGDKLFNEVDEAKALGINPKAVIIGPYTILKLGRFVDGKQPVDFVKPLIEAYSKVLDRLNQQNVSWLQIDEPALSFDVDSEDHQLFDKLYDGILRRKGNVKVVLQNYFGDIRDVYTDVIKKPFDGIGLDLVEGDENIHLIQQHGFPSDKVLFAGVVNGRNVWRNNYDQTIELLRSLNVKSPVVLNTSTSLLFVPYTAEDEDEVAPDVRQHLAFAIQKLNELHELDHVLQDDDEGKRALAANEKLFHDVKHPYRPAVHHRINQLQPQDYIRKPERSEREKIQKKTFDLPILPTTTIGSFPQTKDVRANRHKFNQGKITKEEYDQFNRNKIKRIIKWQEDVGLDVLVHGEYERNDMVEYFGDNLDGFAFTKNGWVQSYGTRGVKPPIIWGDVQRTHPITVASSVYANSLTDHYVKGMITGPVTIFNWSFSREDIPQKEVVTQISLALRDEVLDLEKHGIKIIQIDEPALREGLPLRKSDWYVKYLNWAVPAFRLVHSGVKPTTQIHTHMCYSRFGDILDAIDDLDADVISFEASRGDFTLINELAENHFQTEMGPGVYDIHSPRIPSEEEVQDLITKLVHKLPVKKLWVNPDCGLKTRTEKQAFESLKNIVEATKRVRKELSENVHS